MYRDPEFEVLGTQQYTRDRHALLGLPVEETGNKRAGKEMSRVVTDSGRYQKK